MTPQRNVLAVPFCLYKLMSKLKVEPVVELDNKTVLVIDNDGHVHELHYHGRLIDQPPHDGDGDAD